jgi:hypothetical protein
MAPPGRPATSETEQSIFTGLFPVNTHLDLLLPAPEPAAENESTKLLFRHPVPPGAGDRRGRRRADERAQAEGLYEAR